MSTEYPHFPFWVKDWLSSSARATMSSAERGAYWDLLAFCWDLGCRLPTDENDLRDMTALSAEEWKRSRLKILRNFVPVETTNGKYLTNRRMVAEREKLEFIIQGRKRAGSKGGRSRWGKQSDRGDSSAIVLPIANHSNPEPEPEPDKKKKKKKGRVVRPASLIEAAKEFIRRYQDRDNFQCSDATITKKFFALVDDGIHTPEAILWLLEEWEKSAEWRKGFVTAPDKFLSKSNPKFRKPPRDVRQTDPDWSADGFETFKSE